MNKWYDNYMGEDMEVVEEKKAIPLNLYHLEGLFMIYALCMTAAVGVFAVEFGMKKKPLNEQLVERVEANKT